MAGPEGNGQLSLNFNTPPAKTYKIGGRVLTEQEYQEELARNREEDAADAAETSHRGWGNVEMVSTLRGGTRSRIKNNEN